MFELPPLPKFEDPSLLQELSVHCLMDDAEIGRWNEGVVQRHYLKSAKLVGEQLRYVVKFRGHWVALLGWSAAAWQLKGREAWLGWSSLQRRARLHWVAQNSRFVILADRGAWPNLASRALALVCQQLS